MIAPWERDHDFLRHEVRRPKYNRHLDHVRRRSPEFAALPSWAAAGELVSSAGLRALRMDGILAPLADTVGEGVLNEPATLLMYLAMPDLIRLQRIRRRWQPDVNERWTLVGECFLRSARCLGISTRRTRLGQKLLNDTSRHLYDECTRDWSRSRRTATATIEEIDALGGIEDAAFAEVEVRHIEDAAMRRVRDASAAGVICATDMHLILGTRIHGADLAREAERWGMSYERTKRRRHRAEARVRKWGCA